MKTKKRMCFVGKQCVIAFLLLIASKQNHVLAQDCSSQLILQLVNINGGVFANQLVELRSLVDSKSITQKSDASGTVSFDLPCGSKYSIHISNYTRKLEMSAPENPGAYAKRKISYTADMVQKEQFFVMTNEEKQQLDAQLIHFPDTTKITNSIMRKPVQMDPFVTYTITVKNLENLPLKNEQIILVGTKRGYCFQGKTNEKGQLLVYLPKGDEYVLHFKYQQNYKKEAIEYTKGTVNAGIDISYMGTDEYLRRKKIEDDRIKAEEKRLLEERIAFENWCKAEKISFEEGALRKLKEESNGGYDQTVTTVLNRNKWINKLIVCDLTGSMDPYANQLAVWYQLHYKLEPNLQFVFFNDGNNLSDSQKIIGKTGGIYYQQSKGIDSLLHLMAQVRAKGNGGDCPENNMEALITGVKLAKPFTELVMIVDNNAPVKDIQLLKNFTKPVHIVLCGSQHGEALLDYLLIAWKTKGTIHTMEQDLTTIAHMSEGETISVEGVSYKIMGGVFVRINKQ